MLNRIGDFSCGNIFNLFLFGTINFEETFKPQANLLKISYFLALDKFNYIDMCIFFCRRNGKICNFHHTWLPDAAEGPTPVSALIHCNNGYNGVFLVVRCSRFEYSQAALNLVTVVGMITAIFAASVALVQNDIKKIVAYSTCSQLGYMFFAAGVGAYHVAMFHLFTHAFFKALLFLGAGSIIHAFRDEQDIRNMGGVRKKLPFTYVFMLLGTLALTGFLFCQAFIQKMQLLNLLTLKIHL